MMSYHWTQRLFRLVWKRGPCDAADISQVNTTDFNGYYSLYYEHAERVTQQHIIGVYRRMPEHRFETWRPGDFVVAGHLTMPASAASVSCMDTWSLWHSRDTYIWISSISEANHSCALCDIAVWYWQSRKNNGLPGVLIVWGEIKYMYWWFDCLQIFVIFLSVLRFVLHTWYEILQYFVHS